MLRATKQTIPIPTQERIDNDIFRCFSRFFWLASTTNNKDDFVVRRRTKKIKWKSRRVCWKSAISVQFFISFYFRSATCALVPASIMRRGINSLSFLKADSEQLSVLWQQTKRNYSFLISRCGSRSFEKHIFFLCVTRTTATTAFSKLFCASNGHESIRWCHRNAMFSAIRLTII